MANDEYREQQQADMSAGLKARQATRQERAIVRAEWRAQEDETIGGWCITDAAIPGTPADGNPQIASFVHETVARHMAAVHNVWLANQAYLPIPASVEATIRTQVAEEIAAALDAVPAEVYPEDVFPPDGTSIDCQSAKVMRFAYPAAAGLAREIGSRETSNG